MPRTINQLYHKIFLASDVMLLNDVPFLTSIYEHVHYGIVRAVHNLKCPSLEDGLKKVIRSYAMRGLRIILIAVDPQLKTLTNLIFYLCSIHAVKRSM